MTSSDRSIKQPWRKTCKELQLPLAMLALAFLPLVLAFSQHDPNRWQMVWTVVIGEVLLLLACILETLPAWKTYFKAKQSHRL